MEFNLLNYIKGLRHKFSKNEIAKSCELTLTSLREHTLPAYASAVTLFGSNSFKSSEVKEKANDFKRVVKARGEMIEIIDEALRNAQALLTGIDKKSETLFGDQEASLALTYQKATWLQVVSSVNFGNDYARKFLNWVYIQETAKADSEQKVSENLTKAEAEYIETYFMTFASVVRLMLMSFPDLEKKINDMPDAVVSEMSENVLPTTVGMHRIDPVGLRNLSIPVTISAKWNPFYLIGTMIASFQVAAYNASKEELDLLQLRKMNLESIYAKNPDPRTQRQIEYMTNRIAKLNYELQKAKEEYGV